MWPFDRKIKQAAQKIGVRDLGRVKEKPRPELIEEYGPEGLRICKEIQIHIWCGSWLRVGRRIRDNVLVHWCPQCLVSDTIPKKK